MRPKQTSDIQIIGRPVEASLRFFPSGIRAGQPSESGQEREEDIDVYSLLGTSTASVVVSVIGDSMIDAGIMPGDFVVLDTCREPRSGDIVAIRIDDEVTLKYFFPDSAKGLIRLVPANKHYEPITVTDRQSTDIIGVAAGAYHPFRRKETVRLGRLAGDYPHLRTIGAADTKQGKRFRDCVNDKEHYDLILKTLHSLVDGRRGKYVVAVMACATERGLIRFPSFSEAREEFGNVGSRSNWAAQARNRYFKDVDIDGINTILDQCSL